MIQPAHSATISCYLLLDYCFCLLQYEILILSLQQLADNPELQAEWDSAKMANKHRLTEYILRVTGESIDPNSLFDIQVKRIHEYKRQLLNILGAVYRYKKLKVRYSYSNIGKNCTNLSSYQCSFIINSFQTLYKIF